MSYVIIVMKQKEEQRVQHPNDTSDCEQLKKIIEEKMNSFMNGIREETADQLLTQLSDFRWLSEQSTRFEILTDWKQGEN